MSEDRPKTGLWREIPAREARTIIAGIVIGSVIGLTAMWLKSQYGWVWPMPVAGALCLPVAYFVRRSIARLDESDG